MGIRKFLFFGAGNSATSFICHEKLHARCEAFALIVLICQHLDNSSGTRNQPLKKVDSRFDVMGTFTLSLRIIQADAMTAPAFNGVPHRQFIQRGHAVAHD